MLKILKKNKKFRGISAEFFLPKMALFQGFYSNFQHFLSQNLSGDPYIYMYICAVVFENAVFFSFYAFDNATVYAFNNGVRWVRALKCLFLQCFGGGTRDQLFSWARKISGVILGHHAENEVVQSTFLLFTYGMCFWVGIGCETGFFFAMCKMPRTAGKIGFLHCRCQICNMKVKIGVSEKRPKYISGAAPIIIFVFFGVAPRFGKKRCFQIDEISLKPLKT